MSVQLDYTVIGQRIKQRRLDLGLSQRMLALKAGLSPHQISRIELGQTKFSLSAAAALAVALSISMDKLYLSSIQEMQDEVNAEIFALLNDFSPPDRKNICQIIRAVQQARQCLQSPPKRTRSTPSDDSGTT